MEAGTILLALAALVIFIIGSLSLVLFVSIQRGVNELLADRVRRERDQIQGGYYIGQRVIVHGAICTVCDPGDDKAPMNTVWIRTQSGKVIWRYRSSVKPLPNGQV